MRLSCPPRILAVRLEPMMQNKSSARHQLCSIVLAVWLCPTSGIRTDQDLGAKPFTSEVPDNNAANNAPGGFYRPHDLPSDDPALKKRVDSGAPEQAWVQLRLAGGDRQ